MKRFLILVLFSILIPIQNSSAVSPSLDETIEFLIHGKDVDTRKTWAIDDCNLTISFIRKWTDGDVYEVHLTESINLNKIDIKGNIRSASKSGTGFTLDCVDVCYKRIDGGRINGNEEPSKVTERSEWWNSNGIDFQRNRKALSHLFSNFCTGTNLAF
jgi:hypothetical protein